MCLVIVIDQRHINHDSWVCVMPQLETRLDAIDLSAGMLQQALSKAGGLMAQDRPSEDNPAQAGK